VKLKPIAILLNFMNVIFTCECDRYV